MTTTTKEIHKSRWGYHPCSFETFLQLKELNKQYLNAVRQRAAWLRWECKMPHNRIMRRKLRNSQGQVVGFGQAEPMPEPPLDPLFLEKVAAAGYHDQTGKFYQRETVQFLWGANIPEDYRRAATRRPRPRRYSPSA